MKSSAEKTFESIINKKPTWQKIAGSQFTMMVSNFVGQMVNKAIIACGRYLQEGFISTATKRASILAAAEDKGYIPRLISPSMGMVEVRNKTDRPQSLPLNASIASQQATPYIITDAVVVPPGQSIDLPTKQLKAERYQVTLPVAKKYIEIPLSKEITAKTHKIDVYVTEPGKQERKWTKTFLFRRTNSHSLAYCEFYRPTEQLGIRFGNGINGKIPEAGSVINIVVWTTLGDTTLIPGQKMRFIGANQSLSDVFEVKTKTAIVGGAPAADLEEIRAGVQFASSFDNQIVFDDDYNHFLQNNIPHITWSRYWGEQLQEREFGKAGERNVEWINCVFISAYSTVFDSKSLETKIVSLVTGAEQLNTIPKFIEPNMVPFSLDIHATVNFDADFEQVRTIIKSKLDAIYGKKPTLPRPAEIKRVDVSTIITDLNLLWDYSIVWHMPTIQKINDFLYLDVEKLNIELQVKSENER